MMLAPALPMWSIRVWPLPDELLTSWIIRVAHGFGLKVQTFCNILFGNTRQVWNRDVDRLGPEWLIESLSIGTGTPLAKAFATTLRAYEGILYVQYKTPGALPWIQTLKMHHRKRDGFGIQFCGRCLAEDPVPYFRKRWRVAFNTICAKHQVMLHDRCPSCGSAVAFHRTDVGREAGVKFSPLTSCHVCDFNLAQAPLVPIISYERSGSQWHLELCQSLESGLDLPEVPVDVEAMRVLHHLVSLLFGRYKAISLRQYLSGELGVEDLVQGGAYINFEGRPLRERHFLIQLGSWLMVDLKARLRQAWLAKAFRYNHLLRDFDSVPGFYKKIATQLPGRRHDRRPSYR